MINALFWAIKIAVGLIRDIEQLKNTVQTMPNHPQHDD